MKNSKLNTAKNLVLVTLVCMAITDEGMIEINAIPNVVAESLHKSRAGYFFEYIADTEHPSTTKISGRAFNDLFHDGYPTVWMPAPFQLITNS